MSEPSVPPSASCERHPSLYFPDGDIALSAKSATGITQVFRVDRVVLSRHSEVFRDMLAVALDNSDSKEEFEGVPLVAMPEDDTAEDLSSFLEVVYDASALYRKLSSSLRADTPLAVAGLMNMAKKHLTTNVQNAIVENIASQWPITLAAWDLRALELRDTPRSPNCSYPEPASAIRFASAHGVVGPFLYSAFYQLSTIDTDDIWDDSSASNYDAIDADHSGNARWSLLDGIDAYVLMRGRDALSKFSLKEIRLMLCPSLFAYAVSDPTCDGPPPFGPPDAGQPAVEFCGCQQDAIRNIDRFFFERGDGQRHLDVLDRLRLLGEAAKNEHLNGICRNCKPRITNAAKSLRSRIWDKLPEFFILPRPA